MCVNNFKYQYSCFALKFACNSLSISHSVVSVSFYDPMDCSPPGSSVHGILQVRILEWVAMPFSRIFVTQGLNPGLPDGRQILYHLSHQESPVLRKHQRGAFQVALVVKNLPANVGDVKD